MDQVDLTYNNQGLITNKARPWPGGSGSLNTVYTYDGAYRLLTEVYKQDSTTKHTMTYTYDDAGNRASMQTAVSGGSNNTTNYSYNDYNRLTSDDSYWYSGTNDTGANTYTYDNNGNQTQRAFASGTQEWNYGWNADDRLTAAQWFTEYEHEELGTVTDWVTDNYEYDFAGRRIIEYQEQYLVMNATARTRSFFNGLTEEVRKQSVPNAHAQTAFGFTEKEDGVSSSDWSVVSSGTVTTQSDTPRRSSVIKVTSTSGGGGGAKHTSSDWNSTERVLSFWSKADSGWSPTLDVTISSSGGTGHVIYDNSSGASTYHAPSKTATIHLNGGLGNTYWLRVERNIEADFESVSGATTWTNTDSVTYHPGGTSKNWYVDQIRLSNSYTSEQNILGLGVIGHILANRTWASPGAAPTRTWFHYDQVGSVMATSDYNGSLIARKYQDAFGNRQAGWSGSAFSGLWSPAGGWQHNSKEVDGFTNLTYMYQRWYNSADGRFMSRAPYPAHIEHPYSFALQLPVSILDPFGMQNWRDLPSSIRTKGEDKPTTGSITGSNTYIDPSIDNLHGIHNAEKGEGPLGGNIRPPEDEPPGKPEPEPCPPPEETLVDLAKEIVRNFWAAIDAMKAHQKDAADSSDGDPSNGEVPTE